MTAQSPPTRATGWRARRGDLVGLVLLGLAFAVFPLVGSTSLVNVGVYALIYALAAIGLSLLMGLAGQVSLGHAGFFAIGAYTQAILVTRYDVNGLLASVAAVAVTMLAAVLVGLPLLRLRGHYLALATLGFGIIVSVGARESQFTGATSGIFGIDKPEINGRVYDTAPEYFWLLAPVVLIALLLARNVVESRVGRALGAVNDSEVAAESLGVNTFRLRLDVLVLSAAYASVAGTAFTHWLAVVNPNAANFPLSVKFLLMAVLGGLGTVWGAVIGAFAVEGLDEALGDLIPRFVPGAVGEVELIGFGIVLTALVIFLPGGIHQAWTRLQTRVMAGVRRGPERGAGARRDAVEGRTSPVEGRTSPGSDGGTSGAAPGPATHHPTSTSDAQDARRDASDATDTGPLFARDGRPAPGTPLLEATNLTRRFGGVVAVDDVSLTVAAGEILALIGPNGAGKTTVFNMVSGVLAPTAGTVSVAGRRVEGRKPHVFAGARATRTFQNLQIFASMTVVGNVLVGRHLRSRAGMLAGALVLPAVREERASEAEARRIVDLVGLGEDADRLAVDLPFGRQRLVEVARALASEPDLLLLDEPMAGLSGSERRELARLLRRLRAGGMSIVLVEHDVDAVLALADRVAVLDDGALIALGTPEEIRNDEAVITAYLGVEEDGEGGDQPAPEVPASGAERGGSR
jgi:branched-chain amino acid transport system permease protein